MVHQKSPVVRVEKKDQVAYLTMNRPKVLNALSFELLTALKEELEKIRRDDTVQGVFIRGAGEMGLVNLVTKKETLQAEGKKLMTEILSNGPVAVKFTWEAMHRGLNLSIEESAKLGADYFGLIAATEDFKTGTGAFLNKKTPTFKGR